MSARKSLRDLFEQARRENHLDLRCTTPAYAEAGLHVRFRALTPDELGRAMENHKTDAEAGIEQALDVLVSTCIGVWQEDGGKGISPVDGFDGVIDLATGDLTGSLPKFSDPRLAEALGVADGTAASVVVALLAPNSRLRLMPYADQVADFSTGANDKVLRDASGN